MTSGALVALRELLRDRADDLTFADLSQPLLEDLAFGWYAGRPLAESAAEMLARVDGIDAAGRDREIAGRALLTLLQRRRVAVHVETPGDRVRLLGDPSVDEGDPEGRFAWDRREEEYRSLTEATQAYGAKEFAADAAGAFQAARTPVTNVPPDAIGPAHPLALAGMALPSGLRGWFHGRYGAERADALAWQFVLVSRALARHRAGMADSGVLPRGTDTSIPQRLLEALLALDMGELARTSVLEPD